MSQKVLITSALPYVNGVPHLGHLVGCLLPSDVFARFNRLLGNEVLYIGGTDEYGTPTEVGALKEGIPVREYVDKYFNVHKETYDKFNLSFNKLGRTSTDTHTKLVQSVFLELKENGYIENKEIEQVYSIKDDMFLADRYIEGTCPKCGYEKARGDQCDKCGSLLDPVDLINPYSVISGSHDLEVRKTEHAFLKLKSMQGLVEDWIKTRVGWSKVALSIANKWLKEGLKDRCITRDIKWGIPVPDMPGKVFYVWFDAPWGYVSISQKWAEETGGDWKRFWFENDTRYYQFMGKDNVPFHSVMFPAEELATTTKWKTVDVLKGLNFLNFGDGKFSKSLGNGFSGLDAVELFDVDYWRYWLMANSPESDDAEFTFNIFADQINKDLNDILGNFVLRVLKFCRSKFGTNVPENFGNTDVENKLFSQLDEKVEEYNFALSNLEFRKATKALREIWVLGNEYIANSEPWSVIKTDEKRAMTIIHNSIKLIALFGVLSQPIMPGVAKKLLAFVGVEKENLWVNDNVEDFVNSLIVSGNEIFVPDTLFEKIDDVKVAELKEKYKG